MEARVKSTWPFRTLQGLAGREFHRDEWRPVAPGFEEEAARHPWLEVREPQVIPPEAAEVAKVAKVVKAAPEIVSVETVEPAEGGDFVIPTGFKGEEFPVTKSEAVLVSVETVESKLIAPMVKPVVKPAPKPRTMISKGKAGKK